MFANWQNSEKGKQISIVPKTPFPSMPLPLHKSSFI
jgi:hypothetical protein